MVKSISNIDNTSIGEKKIKIFGLGKNNENYIIPQICYIFNSVQFYYHFHIGEKIVFDTKKENHTRKDLENLIS